MAYDSANKKLYVSDNKGISTSEIAACLGDWRVTKVGLSIGLLCTSPKANKWSFRKPVRHATRQRITDDQIKSVRCGLSPVAMSKLLQMGIGHNSLGSYTEDECRAEIAEWGYEQPRGAAYSEWFRRLDFDGYSHKAVAPDSGWTQKTLDSDTIAKMKDAYVEMSTTGAYAGYNFMMNPLYNEVAYNGGLYTSFAMRFGAASGESVGDITDMDIPIEYITSLDGCWRIAMAVWIPNFGSNGGWGFFASRMTIKQYFAEGLGSGTSLQNLYPDFATNPYAASLMQSYITANDGFVTFDAVPLLVKDLGNTYINSYFALRPVSGVTEAYCMPSGVGAVPLVCGTPPAPIWYEISYSTTGNSIAGYITNTDTAAHTFEYTYNVRYQGVVQSSGTGTVTLAAGEKRQVAGAPTGGGYGLEIIVTSQS